MQHNADQSQSQYAAAAHVLLIKSPSLRVPRPVELPPDIHPLPDDVNAYFVYPFTLEPHIITLEASRRTTLASHQARREAVLRAREEEKVRRKREVLRRIAPGFEPTGAPLIPVRMSMNLSQEEAKVLVSDEDGGKDVMEDLVRKLEAMDSANASATSGS